jgi:lysophospholipase L1-like esterase
MRIRASILILVAAAAAGCGGGGPTHPDGTPTPVPGSPVNGFVFYDENGNGTLDPSEVVRLPSSGVLVGGATASTTAGGRFSIDSVPNGAQTAQTRAGALPSYFTPGAAVSITVPTTGDVAVPAVLALSGRTTPNVYLAFGDSITAGDGSSSGGYTRHLEEDLRAFWGKASVWNDGDPGTKSDKGAARLGTSLNEARPAFVLILYGTNDWNDGECRDSNFPCYTIDSLRAMIDRTRGYGAFPIVGTIPPVNPDWVDKFPTQRNDWVKRMNDEIRAMAQQENVAVADVYAAFMKQPSLPPLYSDFLHPNDAGYQLIKGAFFNVITNPISAPAPSSRSLFSWPFGSR